MTALPVLYQDDHLVAVNKPSGLLVHRSPIDRGETTFALQVLRDQLGRRVYPFHRLDKATSGVLVFALDSDSARRMTDAFSCRQIAKSYLAVVRGFTADRGRIDHPLRDPAAAERRPSKDAVTDYERLAAIELPYATRRHATARFSLVRAFPLTGRTHQVRRHLKHVFHPVIGDTTYGDGRQNELFRERLDCRRLLLHADEIAFPHPVSGLPVRVRAPLDEVFERVLGMPGWSRGPAVPPLPGAKGRP